MLLAAHFRKEIHVIFNIRYIYFIMYKKLCNQLSCNVCLRIGTVIFMYRKYVWYLTIYLSHTRSVS